jgi:hypothetical protein
VLTNYTMAPKGWSPSGQTAFFNIAKGARRCGLGNGSLQASLLRQDTSDPQ